MPRRMGQPRSEFAGDDELYGGPNNDILIGKPGRDICIVGPSPGGTDTTMCEISVLTPWSSRSS